ncbi:MULTISPECIES: hypothetical protein [Rhizobium]|uniref:Uncharacterized protein n=1 Tax=Rhizobium paranaense TaxID=1650438 RepID=A0A7W8XLT1_9HYPH|nr:MULTISPECIES: hypothetical protein [Rhizobium]MBB5571635.1 hypothetical protein [Rhizobium paranaense]PST64161.1 hypothetical protein C9E91_04565 [Rhizobium sp. SEMIA4064]
MGRTMLYRLIGTALLATAILYPNSAASQAMLACAERGDIVAFLEAHYSEKLSAIGQLDPKNIIEIFAAESGSWTMMITSISGRSCVILTGQNWESIPALPGSKA